MSYTPTEWSNGDVITAEKLNHIETGVNTADFVVDLIITNIDFNNPNLGGFCSCTSSLSMSDILSIENYDKKLYRISVETPYGLEVSFGIAKGILNDDTIEELTIAPFLFNQEGNINSTYLLSIVDNGAYIKNDQWRFQTM